MPSSSAWRLLLFNMVMLALAACSSTTPTATPTPFPNPIATFTRAPSRTPRPVASPTLPATVTQPVAIASETPAPTPDDFLASPLPLATSEQCPLNPEQLRFQGGLSLRPSEQDGWCEVGLPLPYHATIGYGLRYPEGWTVTMIGPEGMNLGFTIGVFSDQPYDVAIYLTLTDLPLERADEATYGFEQVEPAPFVDPDEQEISREIRAIGDKQVLVLRTTQGETTFERYFLLHGGTAYIVEVWGTTAEVGNGAMALQDTVEAMIASMTFER